MNEPRRASPEELARWRGRLAAWSRPSRFRLIVEHMRRAHGSHNLDQAGSMFREAFIAGRCAVLAGAEAVRLGADPPDFELRLRGAVRFFEVVEVAPPERRLGVELKAERLLSAAERAKPVHIPQDQWVSAERTLDQVRSVIARKRHHMYARGTILVLYLNIWPIAGGGRISDGLPNAVADGCRRFAAVWVLDGEGLRCFSATPQLV